MDREALRSVEAATLFLDSKVDEDAERVLTMIIGLVNDVFGERLSLTSFEQAATLTNAASVLINAGNRASDLEALQTGEDWMANVVESGLLVGSRFESAAIYNLANSRLGITDLNVRRAWREASEDQRAAACAEVRLADRERLRQARQELSRAASLTQDARERGMRLCNLANTFDYSGRWVEAYDAYVGALDADPSNGNAAGNVAVLIERVISAGWDFEGHLCALYDHYLTLAQDNRAGTVSVAGEGAAARFDSMELLGSDEPLTAPFDEADPYQAWVSQHRLALVAALEGLGSDAHAGRWDTITLRTVTDSSSSHQAPAIFAILNVLKADYLVARRLAFEADQLIEETGCWSQQDEDPGVYTETLNYAVYGEVSSKLVLAHRAALDVLDKTAVAVNEHLQVGDDPTKVSFRRFWFEDKQRTKLRAALVQHEGLSSAILSMAELAIDMAPESLYGHAQDVRNAGTHRFVLVHRDFRELDSTATMKAMTLAGMRTTCIQSLTVARAAFLYLVALLEVFEAGKARADGITVPLYLPTTY
ncbi:LA2681 family HEPN domain-containing protein [uncultured Pseudokineococcus sp.]|uniref:LA2681 family HEPN domain-containing protein n=1 Tax=uncultured Pseudokineococcus sp. TaxID=1642928 RepID=UPI00261CBB80|nr:LA2681 family HEPN domain-containing protein [uncultured Pseudokineococcus sp.]